MFDFQIFKDLKSIGIKDLFDSYAAVNQVNIAKGVAKTNNQIAEWNALAELERMQQSSANAWSTVGTATNGNPMLVLGALLLVGYVAYRVAK